MVLSNIDIENRIKKDQLIKNVKTQNIGAACYELRMGDVYYDLTEGNKVINLRFNDEVIIKPGHRVVLITHEELNIPLDIMARVISKGSLFSIGLTPICTNVDPGFGGNLGLVMQNISDKYITLPKNESLAKIDFSLLTTPSNKPYIGQHGFQTNVWPIKEQLQKQHFQVKSDKRVDSEEIEANRIIPASTANAINKMIKYQRRNNLVMIAFILVNICLISAINEDLIGVALSFGINIVSSLFMLYVSSRIDEVPNNGH
ncbi:hypothetical protein AB6E94_10360 [Vibrio lentus]